MSYQSENNELTKNFLSRTFFKSWKMAADRKNDTGYFLQNYQTLEFDLGDACALRCAYCYVVKYGKEYFPNPNLKKPSIVFKNAKIIMDWLWKNQMRPRIELFGGDALNQDVGFMLIEELLGRALSGHPVCTSILVPTNMNFLLNDDRTRTIEEMIRLGHKIGVPLSLSASVDGIFMEDNRPFRTNKERDKIFYSKLFSFAKTYGIGFHPMVYSNNIEKWWDNFQWFQDCFRRYGIPPTSIYLLEVRNAEWTEKQCQGLYEFMRNLAKWVSEHLKTVPNPTHEFFKNHWGFNILSSPFSQVGRGIGCSLQSSMYLRLGDLTTFPCHRLFYDHFKLFRFLTKDGKIDDIEAISPELYIATNAMNAANFTMCEQCLIEPMCSHGCLGSQYENTGDMFTPAPSVCRMEFYKIKGILDGFKEGGFLDEILNVINPQKRNKVIRIMEAIK